jgi:hypothetical protein
VNRHGTLRRVAVLVVAAAAAVPQALDAQTLLPAAAPGDGSLPTITADDDRMTVQLPDGERLEVAFADEPPPIDRPAVQHSRTFVKTSVCDPYMRRYVGYAPIDPGSHAILGLPPIDADCDGRADRPWYVGRRLDWHSMDSRLGAVDLTDVKAAVVVMRSRRQRTKTSTLFAAVDWRGGRRLSNATARARSTTCSSLQRTNRCR